jgi:hypothetical protein
VPAYNQAKVWNADPAPQARPRPARPRPLGTEHRPHRFAVSRERSERNEKLFVWARLTAVATLGAAILWWPYARDCGFGLSLYLAATMMIIVGGVWVVACTWIQRMARTHALAILVALWGAGLVTAEVLPRIGYAATTSTWLCRAP